MIISALYDLYCRLRNDPSIKIDVPGISKAKVSYELIIAETGELLGINDIRRQEKSKPVPVTMLVPQQNKRTSSDRPYLLCDKADYILGLGEDGAPDEMSLRRFCLSGKVHEEALGDIAEAQPVIRFFQTWNPENAGTYPFLTDRVGELGKSGNLVFRVAGEEQPVHNVASVAVAAGSYMEGEVKTGQAFCLVTDRFGAISKVHNSIKGVKNAQSSGTALVSFNCESFISFGKEQSGNAPISTGVARGYVAALNWLLSDSAHRVQIGDATAIFWAEESWAEPLLSCLLSQVYEEDQHNLKFKDRWALWKGTISMLMNGNGLEAAEINAEAKVFILALSPNNARLSVRFWYTGPFCVMMRNVAQHYSDMMLVRQFEYQDEFIPLPRILMEMAARGDVANLPNGFVGGLLRAIMNGEYYPESVYNVMLQRIRNNDGGTNDSGDAQNPVNYVRVSVIKAILVRKARLNQKECDCYTPSLSYSKDVAYRLGRLFAFMEKAQQHAIPGIKRTIRDSYFGLASGSPGGIFPTLILKNKNHTTKDSLGAWLKKCTKEIANELGTIPAQLDRDQQGKFILGYYHQRTKFYVRDDDNTKGEGSVDRNN